MKRLTFVVCLSLALFASLAIADDFSRESNGPKPFDPRGANTDMLYGGSVGANKAAADSFYVYGGPSNLFQGKWIDSGGLPSREGWIGKDYTNVPENWHISSFNAENLVDPPVVGNLAMWCGETFPVTCGGGVEDVPEGYDNNYLDWLDWYSDPVADPLLPTVVTVKANINVNAEDDFDFLTLQVETAGVMEQATLGSTFTGVNVGVVFEETFTVNPGDYVGAGLDQVHLRWEAMSDGGYSDGDCFFPTNGHTQIDNIEVLFGDTTPVQQAFDDFEVSSPVHWVSVKPPYVGEFSLVWPLLGDDDFCGANFTPQMAFINAGQIDGLEASVGSTWLYGPGGYVVNTTGGLAGPTYGLNNDVWSPILAWPAGAYDGANLLFNCYYHLPIDNGIFMEWWIRSSLDNGVTWGGWKNANTVYYGGGLASYSRSGFNVSTRLTPGRNAVQLALGATEPWIEDYLSNDATPAPYFDNVTLVAYTIPGPAFSVTGAWALFNDGWPEASEIDYTTLANNSVRLDSGDNIAPAANLNNDPGDSVVVTCKPARSGSVLNSRPELRILMKLNPLFGPTERTAPLPAGLTQTGNWISGAILGDTTRTTAIPPVVMANVWTWDLPDTGFFFPGDMMHYYFWAQDNKSGNIGTTLMPADTSGFSFFPGHPNYDSGRYYELYKVDALPTMITAVDPAVEAGGQPTLLFWDDSQDRVNQEEWFAALDNLGFQQGIDYDIYCENAPSSGQGNGLGGKTNEFKMSGYSTLLYTPGNLSNYTICNGDPGGDPGDDIGVLDRWLASGGKNMFATGDNIVQDLMNSGSTGTDFVSKWFGVTYDNYEIRPAIGGQVRPLVSPITVLGAPVLSKSYFADGGCDGGINDFDAITAVAPAVRIAQFMSATGAPMPSVTYAAAVYNPVVANTAEVVLFPYDLSFMMNNGNATGGVATRTAILQDVLAFFGHLPGGAAVGVTPDAGVFTARNFPNPFNPSTKIEFNLPVKGQVELKIYNVRGELVKTLLNQSEYAAGTSSVVWDGRNSAGQSVSSGVYFYSLKSGSYEKMEKMTLVK